MNFTLFYYFSFFIFVSDGPGMSRPLGINARPMEGTNKHEKTTAELPEFN